MALKKTIKDFQEYLGEIGEMSERLSPEQKEKLNTILSSVLTLIVSLRKASHLGEMTFWYEREP